jgi:hypothetical protein
VRASFPTAAEAAAAPSLLAPAVRRGPRGAGALLGAGLLGGLFAPAAVGADNAPPPPDVPALDAAHAADAEATARAEKARETVATVVAPILQRALDEEGRGGFACVAVDPPLILSESEAIDLIRQEFAKAGVQLGYRREIHGFTRTVPDRSERSEKPEPFGQYPAKQVRESWTFDLASEDGSLAVEFLSRDDAYRESFLENRDLFFDEYIDFPELAQRLGTDFSTRTEGPPVAIGLFFDPLVCAALWDREQNRFRPRPDSAFASFTEEELERIRPYHTDQRATRDALLHQDALELLREQVRFFLDWARKEGRLPVPGPQPTAEKSPAEARGQP